MDSPRAEKVAVVDEVRERLGAASASVVTEYRGLTVAELAQLRVSLTAAGGDYKIFKNTLVRRAVAGGEHQPLESLLVGPTAIAFVHGDVSAVAKALRDFARTNPNLVVKGGLFDGNLLSAGELTVLADLPSREVLLARLAGAIAAPLRQLGALMEALPRNLAFGLSALLDQRGGPPTPEPASADAAEPEREPAPTAAAEAAEPQGEQAPVVVAEAAEPEGDQAPAASAEAGEPEGGHAPGEEQ